MRSPARRKLVPYIIRLGCSRCPVRVQARSMGIDPPNGGSLPDRASRKHNNYSGGTRSLAMHCASIVLKIRIEVADKDYFLYCLAHTLMNIIFTIFFAQLQPLT